MTCPSRRLSNLLAKLLLVDNFVVAATAYVLREIEVIQSLGSGSPLARDLSDTRCHFKGFPSKVEGAHAPRFLGHGHIFGRHTHDGLGHLIDQILLAINSHVGVAFSRRRVCRRGTFCTAAAKALIIVV